MYCIVYLRLYFLIPVISKNKIESYNISTYHSPVPIQRIIRLSPGTHVPQLARLLQWWWWLSMFMRWRRLLVPSHSTHPHMVRIHLILLLFLFHDLTIMSQVVLRKVSELLEHARQMLGHHFCWFFILLWVWFSTQLLHF